MALSQNAKNILSIFLRFGVSAALLIYLYFKIDVEKTIEIVKSANIMFIVSSATIYAALIFVMLFRWLIFIRALKLDAHFMTAMRYYFIGLFGNLFLPSAVGGDVIKIIGLCKGSEQKPKVVASVLLDRISGFAGMVTVATFSFIFGHRHIQDKAILISIMTLACISAIVVVVLFNKNIYSFCCRAFSPFPRLKKGLMNVHYDVVLLKDRRDIIYKAVGISCLSQIALAFIYYLIGLALHQTVPLIYFLIFVPLICVASATPSIGGLGVREAGAAFLLAKVGVDSGIAVSISLISYVYMVIMGLFGGIIFATTNCPHKLRNIEQQRIKLEESL